MLKTFKKECLKREKNIAWQLQMKSPNDSRQRNSDNRTEVKTK
jgi:hypothetical protein